MAVELKFKCVEGTFFSELKESNRCN